MCVCVRVDIREIYLEPIAILNLVFQGMYCYSSYNVSIYSTILAKFEASLNFFVEDGRNILGIPLAQGVPTGKAGEVIMHDLTQLPRKHKSFISLREFITLFFPIGGP